MQLRPALATAGFLAAVLVAAATATEVNQRILATTPNGGLGLASPSQAGVGQAVPPSTAAPTTTAAEQVAPPSPPGSDRDDDHDREGRVLQRIGQGATGAGTTSTAARGAPSTTTGPATGSATVDPTGASTTGPTTTVTYAGGDADD